MTGQDGGFREAAARFSAEVQSALTRARRAASEAKAQSGEFRRTTAELAEQAKTGRLRGVRRDQVEPTTEQARTEAEKFRHANGLPVDDLPDADALIARLPDRDPRPAATPEDEDFSQHVILVDADGRDEAEEPDERDTADAATDPETAGIDSPEPENTRPSDDDEDFSQQRILIDATVESYRPDSLSLGTFELPEPENPS